MLTRLPLRRLLNGLYVAAGTLAAICMVGIAGLTLASIIGRSIGNQLPGLADYAGYCMAASSFLALAYTFGRGGHIRVSLVLQQLKAGPRRAVEVWCHAIGFFLAAYLAYYSIKMVRISVEINDISQGPDATPLWLPQLAMAAGTTILAVAILDRLLTAVFDRNFTSAASDQTVE